MALSKVIFYWDSLTHILSHGVGKMRNDKKRGKLLGQGKGHIKLHFLIPHPRDLKKGIITWTGCKVPFKL